MTGVIKYQFEFQLQQQNLKLHCFLCSAQVSISKAKFPSEGELKSILFENTATDETYK